jgi:hypothetical protein
VESFGRSPAQISPLARDGSSLDVRTATITQGVLSNIDDFLRPNTKAKVIRNFHQFSRGMFSSSGGGWKRDAQAALNSGVDDTLDFGEYLDALGNHYLLAQVGNTLYSYDTVSHTGTAITGMTTLHATKLPCIRPAAPTSNTTRPFTIYCNGDVEPRKVYNTVAGLAPDTAATLGFDNGFRTITVTIDVVGSAGDDHILVFTASNLITTPKTLTYEAVASDTTTSVAQELVELINQNLATTSTVGFTATSDDNVITVNVPAAFASGFTLNYNSTGTADATVGTISTAPVFPGTFGGLQYTKPALCAPFQSRVAYTKFANSGSSGNAVAQMLLISGLGDAESFPLSVPARSTDAWSIPIPPICGAPTAIASVKLSSQNSSEQLIIGCQNGVCIVSGTDATNFKLEIYSTQFGIPSNRCFVPLDNAMLFMATDGFRVYTGEKTTPNLITNTISLDIYDQFLQIDRRNWHKAHAVHHRDTQEIWFWVPYKADAGICKHAFILNYNTLDGGMIWYNVDNTSCNASIEFNSTMYGGTELGLIQKWYGVNNYDDITGNVSRETITISGATSAGDTITVTFQGAQLPGSPIDIVYTQLLADTTTTCAAGIAAAINANTVLIDAGISASSTGAVVNIQHPIPLVLTITSATTGGFTPADAALTDTSSAQNILPGAEIVLPLIGVGNVSQFCSIRNTVTCAGRGDQKFLVNAACYEIMDDGSTRKQMMQPLNFTVQSASAGQTALAPASPLEWTLDLSAFPQDAPKFLSDYVPDGHGLFFEFSIACNDSSHNCDFTFFQSTISIGGMRI